MTRKYLPFTIAKNMKYDYVKHCTADFETSDTEDLQDVRVWAWGLSDIMTYDFNYGNNIASFIDLLLEDRYVYDVGIHNLKFDGNYILPELYKRGFEFMPSKDFMTAWERGDDLKNKFTHNITAQGQWFSLTVVKPTKATTNTPAFIHFWDTFKLFPESLKNVGKQYCKQFQKIDEPKDFYTALRPENHVITAEELKYLKYDCLTLAEALRVQFETYGTIYRTRASKAFEFFKACCTTEDEKTNTYKQRYEGLQQYKIPFVNGLEDYAGTYFRYAPKDVRNLLKSSNVKLEKAIDYFIPDYKTWEDFKQAYRGGISYVNPNYVERDVVGNITVLDVNSMYPYCLRNFPIPFGRFIKRKGKPVSGDHTTWIACARVSFKLKESYHLPCIQIKYKYGREWLAESTDYKEFGDVDYYNDDVIWFTEVDYKTYQANYDFTVHEWLTWYEFKQCGNADGKAFIDKYYNQKQTAEIKMKERAKELNNDPALYLNDDKYIKAKMDRQEAKIIMNSAYGKHGTKYILLSKSSKWLGADVPVQFSAETVSFNKEPDDPSHYYIPYACFVTAYARNMLVTAWNTFKGKALYCDTDSIHFKGTEDDIPPELAEYVDWLKMGDLGKWKVEGSFIAGRYLRSKTYIEVDENDKAHITCAGATPEIKELMTWDTFRVGFNAWAICDLEGKDKNYHCKLKPKQYPSGVRLEPQNFEIRPK
ncbi:MAG: hypothetical protein J6R88_00060 [Clostridia bacterium]|nr:hypothetical protein [Clostridia bacterium]